jgi:hypothetical protein
MIQGFCFMAYTLDRRIRERELDVSQDLALRTHHLYRFFRKRVVVPSDKAKTGWHSAVTSRTKVSRGKGPREATSTRCGAKREQCATTMVVSKPFKIRALFA